MLIIVWSDLAQSCRFYQIQVILCIKSMLCLRSYILIMIVWDDTFFQKEIKLILIKSPSLSYITLCQYLQVFVYTYTLDGVKRVQNRHITITPTFPHERHNINQCTNIDIVATQQQQYSYYIARTLHNSPYTSTYMPTPHSCAVGTSAAMLSLHFLRYLGIF